ncbi:MAG TPA: CocE/NonD family hydrolase [Bryobacteraceae bacterium]|nr:CocE/NonD family hydrolase [Bryobacteraceae bacterium]
MKRISAFLFTALVASGAVTIDKRLHLRVATRDGVHLDTNVFLPAGGHRFPTLLVRTPYGKGTDLFAGYPLFLEHGYAVVVQDVRGRFGSEGVFDSIEHEGEDGSDTIDWIARQPWSNGKVGMVGGSYLGIVQWKTAVLGNPHLKAICPVVSGDDDYLDRFYSTGGASKLGHRLLWMSENLLAPGFARPPFASYIYHLPLRTIDRIATGRTLGFYQFALSHPSYDSYWKRLSVREKLVRMSTPVFSVGGWYDNYVESDLDAFTVLHKRGIPARILIGPWTHNMSWKMPGAGFGPFATAPIRRYQIEWFDRWMHPEHSEHETEPETLPDLPVRIFVMGRNQWRDEREWPLARQTITPLYLAGNGHANTLSGDGVLERVPAAGRSPADRFTYDPKNPVPTRGGSVCCDPLVLPWGPMDQRPVETRRDVLVYTSPPLKRDLEVTGRVEAVLFVSTSAADTDFTAKLVDVSPNGETRNVIDGLLRMRYRDGLEKTVATRSGAIYPITIDVGVTSNVFLAGHAIRLEVSSSNFPRFDRNPNTGRPVADDKSLRKAQQTVYHDPQHESRLLLPVIPDRQGAEERGRGQNRASHDRMNDVGRPPASILSRTSHKAGA